MTRAFHLLVALLVAVPLGVGGLCCCLLAPADVEAGTIASEPAHPCCPSEPAPSQDSCPVDQGDEECGCPARDTALVASSGSQTLVLSDSPGDAAMPPSDGEVIRHARASSKRTGVPHPPPKKPLYRTLSVLLC